MNTSMSTVAEPEHYGEVLFTQDRPDEAARLRAIADTYDPASRLGLAALGLGEGWRCLDVGAGPETPEAVEALGQSDAVQLFTERAASVRPDFAVTRDNAVAVAGICHELDGIPLAVELAAARVRVTSPRQIADGLRDRFHLLTGGRRSAIPRHQTLRALIELYLGLVEVAQGRTGEALSRLEASLERVLATGAGMALSTTRCVMALVLTALGRFDEARTPLEQLIGTGLDSGYLEAWTLATLADVLRVGGDACGAELRAREVLELGERTGILRFAARGREILGRLALAEERWGDAEAYLHDALDWLSGAGLRLWIPRILDALAEVAGGLESHDEAARLLGAADRANAELGFVRWAPDQPRVDVLEESLRTLMGNEAFQKARAEGRIVSRRGGGMVPPGAWFPQTPIGGLGGAHPHREHRRRIRDPRAHEPPDRAADVHLTGHGQGSRRSYLPEARRPDACAARRSSGPSRGLTGCRRGSHGQPAGGTQRG